MLYAKTRGRKSGVLACLGIFSLLAVNLGIADAAPSSCITCHMDKEMLKKNITVQKVKTSALQSGAG